MDSTMTKGDIHQFQKKGRYSIKTNRLALLLVTWNIVITVWLTAAHHDLRQQEWELKLAQRALSGQTGDIIRINEKIDHQDILEPQPLYVGD